MNHLFDTGSTINFQKTIDFYNNFSYNIKQEYSAIILLVTCLEKIIRMNCRYL